MKRLLIFLLLLFLAMAVPTVPAQEDDTLSIPFRPSGSVPSDLDPHQTSTVDEREVVSTMCEGLLTLNANMELLPQLAQAWDVSEDGGYFTFSLRDDAYFADHESRVRSITADDVKYSLERTMNLSASEAGSFLTNMELISGIEVIDDYTLGIELFDPTPSRSQAFLFSLALPGTSVVRPELVQENGDEFWLDPGMCIGSYLLADFDPGNSIFLVRNENYYGILGPIMAFNFVDAGDNQVDDFNNGDIDVGFSLSEPSGITGEYISEMVPDIELYMQLLAERDIELEPDTWDLISNVYPGWDSNYIFITPEGVQKFKRPSEDDSWPILAWLIGLLF